MAVRELARQDWCKKLLNILNIGMNLMVVYTKLIYAIQGTLNM